MANLYQDQSKLYKILSHPTRLAILDILRDGEQCVCHMEAMFGLRQAHISQHLMVLREAGLVTDRRDGWNIFYQVIRSEIYVIVDAMNALTGAKRIDYTQIAASQPHRKACPCPKCNPERESYSCEPEKTKTAKA